MNDGNISINMDASEAAKFIGISERNVWYLVKRKEIPNVKIGGRRLFPRDSIIQWIKERTTQSNLEVV